MTDKTACLFLASRFFCCCNAVDYVAGQCQIGQLWPNCDLCQAGRYADSQGQTTCLNCPQGKYSALNAIMSTCTDCDAGKYAAGTGSPACTNCEIGKFQPLTGKTLCDVCPVNSYQDQTGRGSCVQCDSRMGTRQTGSVSQTQCYNCRQGYFAQSTSGGIPTCSPCQPGFFTATVNLKVTCDSCGIGAFSNVTLSTFCYICPHGTYTSGENDNSCANCGTGRFTPNVGSGRVNCTSCTPGLFVSFVCLVC